MNTNNYFHFIVDCCGLVEEFTVETTEQRFKEEKFLIESGMTFRVIEGCNLNGF